ncbi:DUF4190 domain-containing protein [Candidatus Saccharibacteria bacterium]|nr:DUF4190 domain-containing protein [Candidatus Saccharibacteria bacterium]
MVRSQASQGVPKEKNPETKGVLARSRLPTYAVILGIAGILLYPIVIVSILAVVFGLKARREIKVGHRRGRGMVIAGTALGAIGILGAAYFWALQYAHSRLPQPSTSSTKLSAEQTRYLTNRAGMLDDFALGLNQARFEKDRVASLSSTTDGRQDSMDIYTQESFEMAKNGSATTISGNLLLVSKASSIPSLPAEGSPKSSKWLEMPVAYAAEKTRLVFSTAEPAGGRIVIDGDQVTLLNEWGGTLGQYTFTGTNVLKAIQDVLDSKIPPPSDSQRCEQGVSSVDNARVFVAHWDTQKEIKKNGQKTSSNEAVAIGGQSVGSYDCQTKQRRAYVIIDFRGEINGRSFESLVFSPQPLPKTAFMSEIELHMKTNYHSKYSRKLVALQCERRGLVSQLESPIKCFAEDSKDNTTSAEIIIHEDGAWAYKWGPVTAPASAPSTPTAQPPPRAATATEYITIECPSNSQVVERGQAGICSELGTYRHFCPTYTEPVYGSDDDISYCYNPRNEAKAPKSDPKSAWLAPGYGSQTFPR